MGTFAYGDSYYGLRSYDQTTGAVKDASATVTATSTLPAVNYVVAVGSGPFSATSTSSTTCSGEAVIFEDTDKFSYGTGLYGSNEYDQADLQTIVSATSSIASVSGEKINLASATVNAVATVNVLGGLTLSADGTVSASSTTASSGVRYREGSATATVGSSITVSSTATLSGVATVNATSTVVANAEKFFLESSDKFSYGTGLYGLNEYDQADLQTIISATSVSSTASGEKINLASAVSSASATNTADSEKIHQQGGSTTCNATIVARAVTALSSGPLSTSCSSDVVIAFERKRNAEAIVSTTSGTLAVAREKWETVSPTSQDWDTISETSTTWTDIAA
jgi:hypothetical protein